jgi:hypothetical protein
MLEFIGFLKIKSVLYSNILVESHALQSVLAGPTQLLHVGWHGLSHLALLLSAYKLSLQTH